MSDEVAVLFRVSIEDPSDVYALFPEMDEGIGMVACFQHVGQHSMAHLKSCMIGTREATEDEARALKRELEAAPYRYRLRIADEAAYMPEFPEVPPTDEPSPVFTADSACPECGSLGPHKDNGMSGAELSFCCQYCGLHFDSEGV
jgi:hypothetical protein